EPENSLGEAGPPRPDQSINAHDFTAMYRKAHVGKVGQLCEVANLKDWIGMKMLVAAREEVRKSSAAHLPHKVCFVPLINRARTQPHAVAKHGDSIRNRKHLYQFVRDVDDRDALLL